MIKKSLINSTLYQILSFHCNILQKEKAKQFIKLNTDVEMVDLSIKHIINQNSPLLNQCLSDWSGNDRYFRIIKCSDKANIKYQQYENQFKIIVKQLNLFIIILTKNQVTYIYEDSILSNQEVKIIHEQQQQQQQSQQQYDEYPNNNITLISYVFKYSQIKDNNGQSEFYPSICKMINLCFLENSICFKWVAMRDIQYLEKCSLETYQNSDLVERVINIGDMIRFEEQESLEQFLNMQSLQLNYVASDKEYKSMVDYFDFPTTEIDNIYEIMMKQQCIHLVKEDLEFYCIQGDLIKDLIVMCKMENQLLGNDLSEQIQNLIEKHCQLKKNKIILMIVNKQLGDNLLEYCRSLFQGNQKLFSNQLFKKENKQSNIMIEQITNLYLSIQEDLGSKINDLASEQRQLIKTQFRLLLLQNFVIDKL